MSWLCWLLTGCFPFSDLFSGSTWPCTTDLVHREDSAGFFTLSHFHFTFHIFRASLECVELAHYTPMIENWQKKIQRCLLTFFSLSLLWSHRVHQHKVNKWQSTMIKKGSGWNLRKTRFSNLTAPSHPYHLLKCDTICQGF